MLVYTMESLCACVHFGETFSKGVFVAYTVNKVYDLGQAHSGPMKMDPVPYPLFPTHNFMDTLLLPLDNTLLWDIRHSAL